MNLQKLASLRGRGWHPLTAAEWGLLANLSYANGTLPHGNTNGGHWDGDDKECGESSGSGNRTLTGSGPETWTHDHTKTGVHDLCGNIWETVAGLRIKNGMLMVAQNNDAALPETDLTQCGDDWKPLTDDNGEPVYVSASDGKITFTTDHNKAGGLAGCKWGEVKTECKSEMLKEYALFAGEEKAYCYIDATEGEIHFRSAAAAGTMARVQACSTCTPTIRALVRGRTAGAVPLSSKS